MPKRLLLTGVGGFLGSHVLEHVLETTDWEIVGIASWQHKGVPARVSDSVHYQEQKDRVTIITHDLSAPIDKIMTDRIGHIDYVIHAAAESHVDRSIANPVTFIRNNVDVTLTMLEWARVALPSTFIQVSTDEVYGPAPLGHAHTEWEAIVPSNPYSASKAAQEAIAISYWRTYGVPVVITNTMNIFGERQDPEKIIPKAMKCVLDGTEMPVYASGNKAAGTRMYIHCRNLADAMVWTLKNTTPSLYPDATRPDRYHVAGQEEVDNLSMAQLIADIIGKPLKYHFVDFHSTRPGHDFRYALNSSKIHELGWQPPLGFRETLEKTVKWTLDNPEWLK